MLRGVYWLKKLWKTIWTIWKISVILTRWFEEYVKVEKTSFLLRNGKDPCSKNRDAPIVARIIF
jgi:hypothetical protein